MEAITTIKRKVDHIDTYTEKRISDLKEEICGLRERVDQVVDCVLDLKEEMERWKNKGARFVKSTEKK